MTARRRDTRWLVLLAVMAALLVPAVIEAVYVSPTAVFMDDQHRTTQVTLGNSSDVAEEVTVEAKFGFLDTDSAGTPFIRLIDDPPPQFPSAVDWLRLFPIRLRLQPGDKQVLRVLARPPDGLPDGEYWSRLIVTARRAPVAAAAADTAMRVGLNLEIRLITSISYRKGNVTTSVAIRDLAAHAEGDSLTVMVGTDRGGNAAYLGTATFEVVSDSGQVLRDWSTPVAVYYPIHRRFVFPLDSLAPGDYRVRVRFETTRPDLPEDRVLPAPPVADSVALTVG
jgi:P pilus assembly chaperone PapD